MKQLLIVFTLILPMAGYSQELPPDTLWTNSFGEEGDEAAYSITLTEDGGYLMAGYTTSWGISGDVYTVKTDDEGNLEWQNWYGSYYLDEVQSVRATSDGGYILLGMTNLFSPTREDFYLLKLDSAGDTLWTKIIGGGSSDVGKSLVETIDGGFILTGRTESFGAVWSDIWLVKTNSEGDSLWTKSYGGAGFSDDIGYEVRQLTDGGYIILGTTQTTSIDSSFIWLLRTDADGDTLWTNKYGHHEYNGAYSLEVTSDGGFIIAGYSQPLSGGSSDIYILKTDGEGNELWSQIYGGNSSDTGLSVVETLDGGYLAAGETFSFGSGMNDAILIKYSQDGEFIWEKTIGGLGGEKAFDLLATADGGITFTGQIKSSVMEFGDSWIVRLTNHPIIEVTPTYLLFPPVYPGSSSEVQLEISNQGNLVLIIDSINVNNEDIFSIQWNPEDSLVYPGDSIIISLTFTPEEAILYMDSLTVFSNAGISYTRLYGLGTSPASIESADEILPEGYSMLNIYPNPFNNQTAISFQLRNEGRVKLTVFDLTGREVASLVEGHFLLGEYEVVWNAEAMSSGVYFARLETGNAAVTKKLLMTK